MVEYITFKFAIWNINILYFYFRCKLYKTEKCHGSAKIVNAKKKVTNFKDHKHGLGAYKMDAIVLKNKIKSECKTNTEDTANKIFKRLTRGHDIPGVHYDKWPPACTSEEKNYCRISLAMQLSFLEPYKINRKPWENTMWKK